MDYEKKYNEALKRAKAAIDVAADRDLVKGVATTIFPELVDSEDERIRKFLVTIVNNLCAPNFKDVEKKDVLAYLEKQKERRLLTKEEEYTLHRIIEYLEDETCPSEWISLLHDIYCLPYEKQKEQKPTEIAPNQFDGITYGMQGHSTDRPKDRFEEAREKYQVEWSDNDDQLIGFIFDLLNDLAWRKDWAMSKEECLERLKSLTMRCPKSSDNWKPSEEQIHAIVEALKYLPNNKDEWMILNTLVDVLRKLM